MTKLHGIATIGSGKGGIGKTTSALALASAFADYMEDGDLPPILIDADHGASATRTLGYAPSTPILEHLLDGRISLESALHETNDNFLLIPATTSLAIIPLDRVKPWAAKLKELGKTRLVIIDTSDEVLSAPVQAALIAADVLLLPTELSRKSYERTYPEINSVLRHYNVEPDELWFGTKVDRRPAVPREMQRRISDDGVELVVLVPRGIAADEADMHQLSVVKALPKSKVAEAYRDLAAMVYARLRRRSSASAATDHQLRPTKNVAARA
ncbi:MAG: ParA family protein [Acidobacteriaceae bacterium]